MATAAQPALRDRPRPRVTVRGVRLATGLVLFAYVLTHLVNHALGNVSLAAMEWGLDRVSSVWLRPAGRALLYGSLVAHLAVGLWALFRREHFRFRPGEALQLASGLAIPLLLIQHIVATRLAGDVYGLSKGYTQLLYIYVVEAPEIGLLQAATLLVVWTHGVLGLWFWLRLKPGVPRFAPVLLSAAVLLPVLALLGTVQGGREVMEHLGDQGWRDWNLGADTLGTPEQNARLAAIRQALMLGYLGLLGTAMGARGVRFALRSRRGALALTYPSGRRVRVPAGTSVLEASRLHRIPHASVCGGRGRCSTCRIRVIGHEERTPPPPDAAERAVLDRIAAGPGVRLACQFRPAGDVAVAPLLAADVTAAQARALDAAGFGEERFIVAMFVDMRGSTRLAERRLPYDTVFVINRFLEAVGRAVAAAGGAPNQFLGDGMMVLFGLRGSPAEAARQGLDATRLVADAIAGLNDTLAPNLEEPIRFGIGLHAGVAVLGEIGDRLHGRAVFTAIGDPVNVASRLQGLTKRFGVEAVVSEAVFEAAGLSPDLPRREAEIDGRDEKLWVRTLRLPAGPSAERAGHEAER